MKKTIFGAFLIFISLVTACSSRATTQDDNLANRTAANSQETNREIKPDDKQSSGELQKQIEQIATAAKGRVGVGATILETGETVSLLPGERFPMQSVYKVPIGMAVMKEIDAGQLKLDQKIRVEKSEFVRQGMHSPLRDKNPNGAADASVEELLRLSVSESDGTASDVLFRLAGGAEAIGKFLSESGVAEVVVADPEKVIGRDWETQYRNWASPNGAISLLRALHERRGLSESSRALLLKLLTEATTGPRRLKGLLPKGTVVAHKTGTSGTRNGITAATNDIGIINLPNGRHLAIAVFVSDAAADEATRERVIAEIAKAVWDKWSK
ncbi:MAG TPA: class A beta-lactamase, subclass A2 [Pyrinomonadaceae bacterium]|jgi:beta-lactamase class A